MIVGLIIEWVCCVGSVSETGASDTINITVTTNGNINDVAIDV